eukprot:12541313-Alexandrium_andersonii.AAC.1
MKRMLNEDIGGSSVVEDVVVSSMWVGSGQGLEEGGEEELMPKGQTGCIGKAVVKGGKGISAVPVRHDKAAERRCRSRAGANKWLER